MFGIKLTNQWKEVDVLNPNWFERDASTTVKLQHLNKGFTKNGELLKYRCPVCGKLFKEAVEKCDRCDIVYGKEKVS